MGPLPQGVRRGIAGRAGKTASSACRPRPSLPYGPAVATRHIAVWAASTAPRMTALPIGARRRADSRMWADARRFLETEAGRHARLRLPSVIGELQRLRPEMTR